MIRIEIGTVTGLEVKRNQESENEVVLLQCAVTSEDDIRSVELMSLSGFKSRPTVGTVVTIMTIGSSAFAFAADDTLSVEIENGELELYSIESETKKATVRLRTSGVLELNGNVDFAVRYSALEIAFNELKAQFNAHTHPVQAVASNPPTLPISTSPGVPQSVADIVPSKVTKVMLPAEEE